MQYNKNQERMQVRLPRRRKTNDEIRQKAEENEEKHLSEEEYKVKFLEEKIEIYQKKIKEQEIEITNNKMRIKAQEKEINKLRSIIQNYEMQFQRMKNDKNLYNESIQRDNLLSLREELEKLENRIRNISQNYDVNQLNTQNDWNIPNHLSQRYNQVDTDFEIAMQFSEEDFDRLDGVTQYRTIQNNKIRHNNSNNNNHKYNNNRSLRINNPNNNDDHIIDNVLHYSERDDSIDNFSSPENIEVLSEYPNPDRMTYEQLLSLENQIGNVKTGLSQREIDCIPIAYYNKAKFPNQDECSICKEIFKGSETIKELKCGHIYHVVCITKWLIEKKKCPYCNQEVKVHK